MKFEKPLINATLIKRYKRFLADITLADNSEVTAHCANTGAMKGCAESGDLIFCSVSDNPKRKYALSWELTFTQAKHFICVNTLRANQLIEEALNQQVIAGLQGFTQLRREVKYGEENSRIDFLLTFDNKPNTYIEVKSVTLLEEEQGYFPDAVTTRGQKHLRELVEMVQAGHRAVLLFAVLHTGITSVRVAEHIDKKYAQLLREAISAGVEVLAYQADISSAEMRISRQIPFIQT